MSVQTVRRRTTRSARLLAALAVGGLLLVSAALPAARQGVPQRPARGAHLVRLAAGLGAPGRGHRDRARGHRTTISVDGSPIWLRLTGPTGDVTEAPGVMGPGPGRYEMRIRVPEGGPRDLEVMIRGSSDLPIFLMEDPFTFRSDRGRDRPARAAARHDHPGAARGRLRHPRGARRPRGTRDRPGRRTRDRSGAARPGPRSRSGWRRGSSWPRASPWRCGARGPRARPRPRSTRRGPPGPDGRPVGPDAPDDAAAHESALVRSAQAGDADAYGELVTMHQAAAFRVAYVLLGSAADAEDAAQEGFVRAYLALGRFRAGEPFRPWLLQVDRQRGAEPPPRPRPARRPRRSGHRRLPGGARRRDGPGARAGGARRRDAARGPDRARGPRRGRATRRHVPVPAGPLRVGDGRGARDPGRDGEVAAPPGPAPAPRTARAQRRAPWGRRRDRGPALASRRGSWPPPTPPRGRATPDLRGAVQSRIEAATPDLRGPVLDRIAGTRPAPPPRLGAAPAGPRAGPRPRRGRRRRRRRGGPRLPAARARHRVRGDPAARGHGPRPRLAGPDRRGPGRRTAPGPPAGGAAPAVDGVGRRGRGPHDRLARVARGARPADARRQRPLARPDGRAGDGRPRDPGEVARPRHHDRDRVGERRSRLVDLGRRARAALPAARTARPGSCRPASPATRSCSRATGRSTGSSRPSGATRRSRSPNRCPDGRDAASAGRFRRTISAGRAS